jgi:hypothetical protein
LIRKKEGYLFKKVKKKRKKGTTEKESKEIKNLLNKHTDRPITDDHGQQKNQGGGGKLIQRNRKHKDGERERESIYLCMCINNRVGRGSI